VLIAQGAIMIKWCPPKPLYVKLNANGVFKDKKVVGCGGVIRGTEGEWLGGFAKCVGLCSAFVVELWGVVEGLQYAYCLGFKQIELNIDSEDVVRVIKNGSSKNGSS
jgi:ribonuclease HI